MLQETYLALLSNYTDDLVLKNQLWDEIEQQYTHKIRHYHSLEHLAQLHNQLIAIKSEIHDWNVLLFTLFYHDLVYSAMKRDNEEL